MPNLYIHTWGRKSSHIFLTEERWVISFTFQSISPGVVKTDFLISSGTNIITPDAMYSSNPYLLPKDIADAVLFALGCPPHVQVILLLIYTIGWFVKPLCQPQNLHSVTKIVNDYLVAEPEVSISQPAIGQDSKRISTTPDPLKLRP
jgi:hypothetical protein